MPTVSGLTVTLADRVQETTQTTGTGTYNLDGAATGKRTFIAGIGNGVRTVYVASLGANWEVGVGTVTTGAPSTLSRDAILASTNSNNAVSWGAGSKDIFCDIAAALANQIWTRPGASFAIGAIETRGPTTPSGSQSAIDFTSIASTARIIHIGYSGIIRGANNSSLILQIGDSGGLELTGYTSIAQSVAADDQVEAATATTAFYLAPTGGASITQHGAATLMHLSAGLWTMSGSASTVSSGSNFASSSSGSKTLSGTLDRVRFTNADAANFSAGGSIVLQIIHAVT